jgi:UDP-glucose 4-epimerase
VGNILVTGANGYLGSQFVLKLLEEKNNVDQKIICLDIHFRPDFLNNQSLLCIKMDIRSNELHQLIADNQIETVVHLAAIISTPDKSDREKEYDIDVNGTKNLVNACIENNVSKFIVTSSGAAYGYHKENNNKWITEDFPIAGNYEFAYSHHKRLIEAFLAEKRTSNPSLQQYVFRVGTILGKTTKNPITEYLEKPKILEIKNHKSPFVFIWDNDLVGILLKAVKDGQPGIYNVAGDGSLSVKEIASIMGKKNQTLPAWLIKGVFGLLYPLGLSKYNAFIVNFVQYRPVLLNTKLKEIFNYTPSKTTKEVFDFYLKENINRKK